MNFDDIDLNELYAHSVENDKQFGNNKEGEGQDELQKMRNDPITKRGMNAASSLAKGAKNKGSQAVNALRSKKGGKGGTKASGGTSSTNASGGSAGSSDSSNENVDQGGKYDTTKALLNKFKFRLQKNSDEEAKAEAEANRCDPCNEFKVGNGLDLGCVDWGKCAYFKPCVKKFPYPCSCMAYLCLGVTFVGGLLSSIILF